jgi:hypothetical protein
MEYILQNGTKKVAYKGERESDKRMQLPTCECECTEVQCTGQRVQPGRVTTMEEGATIGMTAPVY